MHAEVNAIPLLSGILITADPGTIVASLIVPRRKEGMMSSP